MRNGLILGSSGTKYWYKDNKLHREDGPAIIFAIPELPQWWYQDEYVSVSSQQEFEQWLKYKAFL